jgi:CDP-diacylglycerol--glycerol-3-phosphate 3-phosphatidyltransferase
MTPFRETVHAMISRWLGHRLDPYLAALAGSPRRALNPNALTLAGLVINAAAAFFLSIGWWKAGGVTIIIAGLFDVMDGAVARAHGKVTVFGSFLDSVIDRYSDFLLFIGVFFFYAAAGRPYHILLASVAAMGSFLVPFARARAETVIPSCKVGIMERPERILLLAVGSLFDVMVPVLWILTVLSHITVLQRIVHTRRQLSGR